MCTEDIQQDIQKGAAVRASAVVTGLTGVTAATASTTGTCTAGATTAARDE